MGRRRQCTICARADIVVRLDYLIAKGAPIKALARQFGVSGAALARHAKNHVSAAYKRAVALGPFESEGALRKIVAESGSSVLETVRAMRSGYAARWQVMREAGADGVMVMVGREIRALLDLEARITKELAPTPSMLVQNFFQLPDFLSFQSRLLNVLARHPEANAEVLREFQALEPPAPIEVSADAAD